MNEVYLCWTWLSKMKLIENFNDEPHENEVDSAIKSIADGNATTSTLLSSENIAFRGIREQPGSMVPPPIEMLPDFFEILRPGAHRLPDVAFRNWTAGRQPPDAFVRSAAQNWNGIVEGKAKELRACLGL